MTPTFTISHTQSGVVQVLHLSGVLDEAASPELARCVAGLSAAPLRLVLDVSGLRYASSVGIGLILTLNRRLRAGGGILVLAQPGNAVAEVLVTLNLAAIIPIHATVEHGVQVAAG
jgi:anti-sigma B factor antagonist